MAIEHHHDPTDAARPLGAGDIVSLRREAARLAELDRPPRDLARSLALLADHGLLLAPLPASSGGRGLGTHSDSIEEAVDILIALAAADLPLARVYEAHLDAIRLVVAAGRPATVAAVTERARAGRLTALWLSGAARLNGGRLAGTVTVSGGLGLVGLAVVSASSGGATRLVAVDSSDPGRIAIEPGGRVGAGRFLLDGLPAPEAAWLKPAGAEIADAFAQARNWRRAAVEVGGALGLIGVLRALGERGSFVASRLGDTLIASHAARGFAIRAGRFSESAPGRAQPLRAATMARFARLAADSTAEQALARADAASSRAGEAAAAAIAMLRRELALLVGLGDSERWPAAA